MKARVRHGAISRSARQFVTWAAAGAVLTVLIGLLAVRRTSVRRHDVLPGVPKSADPISIGQHPVVVPLPAPERAKPLQRSTIRKSWSSKKVPTFVAAAPPVQVPSIETFFAEHYALGSAWSRAAGRDRAGYAPRLNECAKALKERRPDEGPEGRVEGSVAVTFQVKGGIAHVARIRPLVAGDQAFAECFSTASPWANEDITVSGEKDGTYESEWTYRLRAR
jgi:hypothetical protein